MGRLSNGQLQGYPIDFDHSIHVKDRNSNTGEPKRKSHALHRTGTAPFMALDHLSRPTATAFPYWHLPRFDIEAFIWVLCWTLHHFKPSGRGASKNRKWCQAPKFDFAFSDNDQATARSKKFDWARAPIRDTSEIHSSWDSIVPLMNTLVQKVVTAYAHEDVMLARKAPNPPKKKPNPPVEPTPGEDVEMAPAEEVKPDFFELEGAFRVDDVIAIVSGYYAAM